MITTTPLERWILERTGIREPSRKALAAYQLNEIKETIRYARENSVFYARHLKDLKIDKLEQPEDLSKVPFTESFHIQGHANEFLCVSPRNVSRIVTINSSGTTGEEKRIFFTERDLERTVDFFEYGMSCLTDPRDRVLVLLPGASYGSIGDLLKKALERSGTFCAVYGVLDDAGSVADVIRQNHISCLVGIPSQILYLSRICPHIFGQPVQKVLLSTDYVPDILVQELKQKYDCRVFNHYGMTEMGYGGGVECAVRNGCHLREGDLYLEVIDPLSGRNVPDGEYGEVVFTSFGREAMPLIRYRTGDIARFKKEACACGTFLRTLEKVQGRRTNILQLSENRLLSLGQLDELVYTCANVLKYQPTLMNGPSLLLEIAWKDQDQAAESKEQLLELLQTDLGEDCRIRIEEKTVHEWPQIVNSMGKRIFWDGRKG